MAYTPKQTPISAVKTTTETKTTGIVLDSDLSVSTTVSGYYQLEGELIFNHNLDPEYSFQVVSTNATILSPLAIPTLYTADWVNLTAKQTAERYWLTDATNFTWDAGNTAPIDPDTVYTTVKIGPGIVVSSGIATVGIKWGLEYTDADPQIRVMLREGSSISLTRIKLE